MRLGFLSVLTLASLIVSCTSFSSEYISIEPLGVHPNGTIYIGMERCTSCHLEIVNAHKETAHWLTSSPLSPTAVAQFLSSDSNSFDLKDQTRISFFARSDSLFQDAYRPPYATPFFTKSLDIKIGSGTKIGNSFLSWEESSLFQLQGSFYKPTMNWINSPGYPSFFQPLRPIFPRCLECHTTFSQSENWESPIPTNRYNKDNIVFGIDCQRCHGEVVDHVTHHRNNPMDSIGRNIISYADFNQQQRIDMCALCHSGVGTQVNQPAFSFTPGDTLQDFLLSQTTEEPDVHSNQVALLTRSPCFINSKAMDCMSCHDPHSNEKNNRTHFNSRCVECHPTQQHKTVPYENAWDCIACHMPERDSKLMKIQITPDSIQAVKVRTHRIGIYLEERLIE